MGEIMWYMTNVNEAVNLGKFDVLRVEYISGNKYEVCAYKNVDGTTIRAGSNKSRVVLAENNTQRGAIRSLADITTNKPLGYFEG